VQMLMMAQQVKPRVYGYLYNFYNITNIPNTDWRLPTEAEFNSIKTLVGTNGASKLRSIRKSPLPHPRWNTSNSSDDYNLNVLPGGLRGEDGIFNVNYFVGKISCFVAYPKKSWYYPPTKLVLTDTSTTVSVSYDFSDRAGTSIRLVRPLETGYELLTDGTYVTDYVGNDGKRYKAVKIGTLVWLAENLAETLYNDLSPIPNVTDNAAWAALTTGARCAYNNDENYV